MKNKYARQPPHFRGGATFVCLTLCEIFQMFYKVKEAMLAFISFFKKNVITHYTGKNVLQTAEELLGMYKRSESVKALTHKHVQRF